VDIFLNDKQPWPFADYTLIQKIVTKYFSATGALLETFVFNIHTALKEKITVAEKIKVAVRKLHPPMSGNVAYAQCAMKPQTLKGLHLWICFSFGNLLAMLRFY